MEVNVYEKGLNSISNNKSDVEYYTNSLTHHSLIITDRRFALLVQCVFEKWVVEAFNFPSATLNTQTPTTLRQTHHQVLYNYASF